MRKMKSVLCIVLILVLLTGCIKSGSAAADDPTVAFTDSLGRTVDVPSVITRVAVTGPLAQIVVFSAAPEMLTALASDWSEDAQRYIDPQYYDLPVLGQLYGGNSDMNIEELAKAAPQVIIDVGESKADMAADMDSIQQQTGIPTVHISADLNTMDDAYGMLGDLLGVRERTDLLAAWCVNAWERTESIMAAIGEDEKTSVLYCLGDLGCNVIARDSYHSTVLDMVTDNLAVVDTPSSKGTGNEVNMEQMLLWNPEVIIFAPNSMYDYVEEDPLWENLDAIENDAYYEVPYGIYNWMGFPPSVQRYLGMLWLTELLYPEHTDYDLYEEVSEFYELFFHSQITREQYADLTAKSIGKMEAGK